MEDRIGKHADEQVRAAFRETGMTMSELNRLRLLRCIEQMMRDDRMELLAACIGADAEARRIARDAIAKARRD